MTNFLAQVFLSPGALTTLLIRLMRNLLRFEAWCYAWWRIAAKSLNFPYNLMHRHKKIKLNGLCNAVLNYLKLKWLCYILSFNIILINFDCSFNSTATNQFNTQYYYYYMIFKFLVHCLLFVTINRILLARRSSDCKSCACLLFFIKFSFICIFHLKT